MLLTEEIAARLVTAESACYVDWVSAIAAMPSNPLRAEVREFGRAVACLCAGIPAEIWNRTFGLTLEDADRIPEIARFYRERGAKPLFDVDPFSVTPFYAGPNVLGALARHGFYQAGFHQMLYGAPRADVEEPAAGVEVREVGPEEAEAFGRVYETVWGGAPAINVLLGRPEFRCYLGYVEGELAGLGVLHVRDGAASMANGLVDPRFRNRGCQTALLNRRVRDAALMGCDLLVSQCRPASQSERNQRRVGFQVAGSKAGWIEVG